MCDDALQGNSKSRKHMVESNIKNYKHYMTTHKA